MPARRGNRRRPRRVLLALVLVTLTVPLLAALSPPATARPNPVSQARRPIVLDPELGLFDQFGYQPAYTRNVPTFDASNRPYIRSRSADPDYTAFVHTLRDGRWVRLDLLRWVRAAYPDFSATVSGAGSPDNRVVFDASDRAYTLLEIRLENGSARNLLLWSTDHGASWQVVTLPAGGVTSETFVGHNTFDGPPLLVIVRKEPDLDPYTRNRRRSLWVTLPRLENGTVVVPEPVLVSAHCLGNDGGSGDTSLAVSHGDSTEIVWTETTDRPALGGPTCVATFDRRTGTVGRAVIVARTLPGNDGHARPGICLDSQGYLHVLTGAHGTSFQYTRSLAAGTPYAGWTTPEPVLVNGWRSGKDDENESGRQTYLSFVCDRSDTLHIAFRQWRRHVDPCFFGANYGALSCQYKRAGDEWSEAQVVVVPPYAGYAVYMHQLTVDRRGRLYLAAACIAGPEVQARRAALARRRLRGGPLPPLYLRRMLLVPTAVGHTWRFATTADFAAGVSPPPEAAP
ncbi:MAG TPA: BNR-4 repeat-containing protein [Thermoleophilia bacterium]|nr:BNR-4 repeat-containing protein [Thermoleophilia bacterium]HQG03866.1 BNR-4 repeat-containing protein [Thermoleophilia bacterium]